MLTHIISNNSCKVNLETKLLLKQETDEPFADQMNFGRILPSILRPNATVAGAGKAKRWNFRERNREFSGNGEVKS